MIAVASKQQDFGYSLGVLHHVPDTEGAIRECVANAQTGGAISAVSLLRV